MDSRLVAMKERAEGLLQMLGAPDDAGALSKAPRVGADALWLIDEVERLRLSIAEIQHAAVLALSPTRASCAECRGAGTGLSGEPPRPCAVCGGDGWPPRRRPARSESVVKGALRVVRRWLDGLPVPPRCGHAVHSGGVTVMRGWPCTKSATRLVEVDIGHVVVLCDTAHPEIEPRGGWDGCEWWPIAMEPGDGGEEQKD